MGHTRHRRRGHYRALRDEAPSTVAVLTGEADFAAMRTYRSFTFEDYGTYLRHVEQLLRVLAGQGVHTRVALFDPDCFGTYCEEELLDPDAPDSRTRYTAEVAGTGPTVEYAGQSVAELLPLLRRDRARQLTWEAAGGILAREGGAAALGRARQALVRLLDALGPGAHHLVCSISAPGGPLLASLYAAGGTEPAAGQCEADALLLCGVLAAGFATGSAGGLVARTTAPGGAQDEVVRGWCVQNGWLSPLTEAEVFSAYCTSADTGEPVPPESGVAYRPGIALPRPADRQG